MSPEASYRVVVESEISTPVATAQVVHVHTPDTKGLVMQDRSDYWLDLCLSHPRRHAAACYREHWGRDRYEPLGRAFLLPPQETIEISAEGSPSHATLRCYLRPGFMHEWLDAAPQWTNEQRRAGLNIVEPGIESLLLRLTQEIRQPRFSSATLIELMFAQLAIELRRYLFIDDELETRGLSTGHLRLIDERLHEPGPPPSVTELAALCKLSVRELSQAFRLSRGVALGQYIVKSRIENAKRLLAGDQSIKVIAYALGFASPSSFCYAFRQTTGLTPLEFRQSRLRS